MEETEKTLSAGNNRAKNNYIHVFNRLVKTYRLGIRLSGVGSAVTGNIIESTTHGPIFFSGNDHIIEYNEITNVVNETGHAGGIHTGRDWTARGTVIRGDYLHNIHGPGLYGSKGVYLDDQVSGITITQNISLNVDQAIFIGVGSENKITNNIFIESTPVIHIDARGLGWQKQQSLAKDGPFIKQLLAVPYDNIIYTSCYPGIEGVLSDSPGKPKGNLIENNIIIRGKVFDVADAAGYALVVAGLFQKRAVRIY